MMESNDQNRDVTKEVVEGLVHTVDRLSKELTDLKNNKVKEMLQLPDDILEDAGVISRPQHRLRVGRGWRPLMESEVKEAYEHADTAIGASRYLGVGYRTFRRYAKQYGLWHTNPWTTGSTKKYWDPNKGKYPLTKILNGEFPEYPIYRLKDLLTRSGTKKAECEQCGFGERRITDEKMPLILNFEDGNEKNHRLENIRVLCYNCTFLCGKGYIRKGKKAVGFDDPDKMQDAKTTISARF